MKSASRRARLATGIVLTSSSLIGAFGTPQGTATQGRVASPIGQQPPQTLAAPEGTAAISGVVIDGATDRPLGGAIVTLSGIGRGLPTPRITTDDRGRFIFTQLPSSQNYAVIASRIGYFDSRISPRIALVDGQWVMDVRLVVWKLGSISGVVTDEANEPVVGALVRVLSQVLVSGLPQLAGGAVARTDDRGAYRIAGLGPGKYLVLLPSVNSSARAIAPGATLSGVTLDSSGGVSALRSDRTVSPDGRNVLFLGSYPTPPSDAVRQAYPITFSPSARSPRDAGLIELKNGESRAGVDIQVRPVPVVNVSGVVEGPTAAEPVGMTLRLVPAGMEGLANGSEAATALVPPDGRFTFIGVPQGDYTLITSRTQMEYRVAGASLTGTPSVPNPPGLVFSSMTSGVVTSGSANARYVSQTSPGSPSYSARVAIAVGKSDLTNLVVPLIRGATISGRIVYDTRSGTGVDARALPSVAVFAEPADGNALRGMPTGRITASGTDQTFAIEGIQAGTFVLRLPSLGGGRIKSILWDGRNYANRAFDVTNGHDIADVVVTITDTTQKISGYVRDPQNQNQMAARGAVILFPVGPDEWSGYGLSPTRIVSVPIATSGSFTINDVPAGDYYAIAVGEGLETAWQDPRFLSAASALASKLKLEWNDAQRLDLVIKAIPGFRGGGG